MSRYSSSGVIVPSGASQVASSMLLAFASVPRIGSATTQSSLHQPGFAAASSQDSSQGEPPGRLPVIFPSRTSSSVHVIEDPALIVSSPRTTSVG